MAKSKTPAKRHRQSLKRRDRNFSYRSKLKTYMKDARTALTSKSGTMETDVRKACRELDRMVNKGIIKKNNASRRKSRLMKAFNSVVSGAGGGTDAAGTAG